LPNKGKPDMDNYQVLFENAVTRTRKHGLRVPHIDYAPTRLLTDDFHKQFPYKLRDAVGNIGVNELLLQCLSIHHRLLPAMRDMLKSDVFFTIGWMRMLDSDGIVKRLYEFDDDWVATCLKQGTSGGPTAKLHAWLTLPSMEIIDLSIMTSIAIVHELPEGLGGVLANHADELVNGVRYVPMLVGDDFLRRTGMLLEF